MAQLSSHKLQPKFEQEILRSLQQLICDIKKPQDAEAFLRDFLTPTEHAVLAKRLAIAVLLDNDKKYEEIQQTLKVSSATVSMVAAQLETPGIKQAIQKVRADKWATGWTAKLTKSFGSK